MMMTAGEGAMGFDKRGEGAMGFDKRGEGAMGFDKRGEGAMGGDVEHLVGKKGRGVAKAVEADVRDGGGHTVAWGSKVHQEV